MSNPPSIQHPSRGVSVTTLILTAALAVATTVAVVLAVLYVTANSRPPVPGQPVQPSLLTALTGTSPAPFVQKDTVRPQGEAAGEVFYPIPYAAPPHLTLAAPHRIYRIVKQDEYGFSWAADSLLEDFAGDVKDLAFAIQTGAAKKPGVEYEDFTWEAKGVPVGSDADIQRPYEQSGSFHTVIGTQGQENFAIPYVSPPQVTLMRDCETTVVVEATTSGFKWKNGGTDAFRDNGTVDWTAKGIRATKLPK